MEVRIRDLTLHYEIRGSGKPFIMLHGYSEDHRVMEGCMEPLFTGKEHYKRIYLDLPGMGKSKSAEWITSADIMLEVIIEFIEKVIPGQNFLLAGESFGGYLARGIIYKMPEKVDGVLLICPAIIADRTKRDLPEQVVLIRDDALISSLDQKDAESFGEDMVMQNRKSYERYRDEILSGINIADIKFLDNLRINGYSFSFNVDSMKVFDKPSLFLLGKQDSCVGFKDAWNILDLYPRASFAVLDMSGHNLQIEQEVLFNSLVVEWLQRVKTCTAKEYFETERLIIRRFRSDDWKDLHDYLSSEIAVKYEPYDVFSEEASKEEAVKRSNNEAFWAVCLRESGKVIGNVYFQPHGTSELRTWEIGYIFNPSLYGKGYATESCRRIIDYAFIELEAHRVIAMCNPLNTSSWKLLERLGMRREGHLSRNIFFKCYLQGKPVWNDTYEYAILADEWLIRDIDKMQWRVNDE